MTHAERGRFIRQELQGLWPQWSPTEAEVRLWMGLLSPYDYEPARRALGQAFCEKGGNYRRPLPAGFLTKVRALSMHAPGPNPARQAQSEPDVFVQCVEPPAWNPGRLCVPRPVYVLPAERQSDRSYVTACAQHMRQKFEQLYGGRWIVVTAGDTP